jgi:hypothetical protein
MTTTEELGLTEIGSGMWQHESSGWTVSLNSAGTMLTAEAPWYGDGDVFDVMVGPRPFADALAEVVGRIDREVAR